MSWDSEAFDEELQRAVESFDRPKAESLCDRLIGHLHASLAPYEESAAKRVLGHLQRKRYFDLLQRAADALQQTGQRSPRIRRQYAQALLDQGALAAALPFLESLVADTAERRQDTFEHSEARGLLGRAHKQIYVDTDNPARAEAQHALNESIRAYLAVYQSDPAEHSWHGINTVALLRRAAVDDVPAYGIGDPEWRAIALAEEILSAMEMKWRHGRATMWDSGTAMEACVALGRIAEAREWLGRYVREPSSDAFELASTLRQLEQVWRLDVDSEPGASLLPVLRAELLTRRGGELEVKPAQLRPGKLARLQPESLEKILGKTRYVSYKFMLRAIERARFVARIEHQPDQGYGTGFVVRGNDLHASLGDNLFLLTNAHVVSEDPKVEKALHPENAIITFQLLKEEGLAKDEYSVDQLVWSSPPWELDATLLRLNDVPSGVEPFPVARRLPLADSEQRVYVVGHPKGGSLSFSIHDNVLLDHEAPLLHYRAPTEGGSSGSPVFNSQWKLVGLHHAGSKDMPRLHDKGGTYAANEGVWIQSIIEAMSKNPQKIMSASG